MNNFCRKWLARSGAVVLATASGVATSSQAQEPPSTAFQAEHFEWMPIPFGNLLNVATTEVLANKQYSAGILVHYSDDPLTLVRASDDGTEARVIASKLVAEVVGGVGLYDLADVGLALPTVLYQNGADLAQFQRPGQSVGGLALGDMRVMPRLRLPVDRDEYHGFGMALAAIGYIPIGDDATFNSDGDVRMEPRLLVDWRNEQRGWAAGLNLGFQLRPRREAFNYISGDMFRWGVGVQAPIPLRNMHAVGTVFGNLPTTGGASGGRGTPVEALLAVSYPLPKNFTLTAGASAGLTHGIGAPDYRILAGIQWTTPRSSVSAVVAPTKLDRYLDRDSDGIFDEKDACPDAAEVFNGVDDDDGCPDEGESAVRVTTKKIEFSGQIFFLLDDDRIQDQSLSLLNGIAAAMSQNPQMTKVRIEGHTDSQGSDTYNKDLSQRRTDSVRAYLVSQGIDAARLEPVGYGESQPIADNGTPEGRSRNRRVEFTILEVNGKPIEGGAMMVEEKAGKP